jgi:hypothetical protein
MNSHRTSPKKRQTGIEVVAYGLVSVCLIRKIPRDEATRTTYNVLVKPKFFHVHSDCSRILNTALSPELLNILRMARPTLSRYGIKSRITVSSIQLSRSD